MLFKNIAVFSLFFVARVLVKEIVEVDDFGKYFEVCAMVII